MKVERVEGREDPMKADKTQANRECLKGGEPILHSAKAELQNRLKDTRRSGSGLPLGTPVLTGKPWLPPPACTWWATARSACGTAASPGSGTAAGRGRTAEGEREEAQAEDHG